MTLLRRGLARLRRLRGCERGSATVEFVIWLPFFFGLVALITDASVAGDRYSEMWDTARAAARELAMGGIPRTKASVAAFVQGRLSADYAVTLVGRHTPCFEVHIRAAPGAASLFGLFDAAAGGMTARVGLGQEPMASV